MLNVWPMLAMLLLLNINLLLNSNVKIFILCLKLQYLRFAYQLFMTEGRPKMNPYAWRRLDGNVLTNCIRDDVT